MMGRNAAAIRIKGRVQGVGFRPRVYQLAKKDALKGWVRNNSSGVYIHLDHSHETASSFLSQLMANLPPLAMIIGTEIIDSHHESCAGFSIKESLSDEVADLHLTPDAALCSDCRREIMDPTNRRYGYPFITCTNCGPRYSIMSGIPYDRPQTTMAEFSMCADCQEEYHDPLNRRHFSQTNSCPQCRIRLNLHLKDRAAFDLRNASAITGLWRSGSIVAIKGIGGYLLTCDANSPKAIRQLRLRKQRPEKPLAVMFPNLASIEKSAVVLDAESRALQSTRAPIVLLRLKAEAQKNLDLPGLLSGLDKIGAILPYSPLYHWLLADFGGPVVATSGNLSNATIVYQDQNALTELGNIADAILTNNRAIVTPQDDGVEQYGERSGQRIILRRSRGLAPGYFNPNLHIHPKPVLATGALLKSSFALTHQSNLYLSQYLGNGIHYEAQQNYEQCFSHLQSALGFEPEEVISDLHPEFHSTQFGKDLARKYSAEHRQLQHHRAHFYAVMGEHNLISGDQPVLGFIWDGTGLGDDGQIWGGEVFHYHSGTMNRVHHLEYFPLIAGDKMAKEPRISALALAWNIPGIQDLISQKFSETELKLYLQLKNQPQYRCSSMGRVFDAVASLLLGADYNNYEGQAGIQLEQLATTACRQASARVPSVLDASSSRPLTEQIMEGVVSCLLGKTDPSLIALGFHHALIDYVVFMASRHNSKKLAFSGGVFQNALLVDLLVSRLGKDFQLHFHHQISPNDESIAFGQLMWSNARNLGIFG